MEDRLRTPSGKIQAKKAKRVLVWDVKNEYGPSLGLTVVKTLSQLLKTLKATKNGGRFAYVPSSFSKQEF